MEDFWSTLEILAGVFYRMALDQGVPQKKVAQLEGCSGVPQKTVAQLEGRSRVALEMVWNVAATRYHPPDTTQLMTGPWHLL